ncbi:Serine/threonine-protein kinase PknB [Thalassoglobus neptunius]|uniref:Serine/threonine-protein kinase PknB n=1 Tax=Thalassoglobus neptunius TaxID=1938619 RepID=A0A5C5X425_9PLAN|nr:serine/threonine-protein kinase [Thalassoglobus neptunius]TWT57071.1 Serine/threonine-protein kinase PknB [Thalassoglobus neptunius]
MTVAQHPFLNQLLKSRILSPARIQQFADSLDIDSETNSVDIAMAAVKSKLISRYQAEEILNGRGRHLTVDNYSLVDILGYGGMGTVYIARHQQTGQFVAVKLLGELTKHDIGIRTRFQLEARAGMKLDHPKLVKTFQLGTLEALYGETEYMVMELVQGVTLLEGISFSSGPLKHDAACDVICQAAEGLQYLHDQGMVHRDVKPDNILIEVNGNAKLLDFGLTLADEAAFDEEFSLAMIFGHDCLGTADFIPPEQSLDSLKVDPRADMYSLGCTLYTALTAKRPFPGLSRVDTVKAHRNQPRPRIEKYNPKISKDLSDLVERMMAIDPEDRPATMTEVISLLEPYRKRRNWTFEFNQVLQQRRELRRKYISESRARSGQSHRTTEVNSPQETETPGKKKVTGDRPLEDFES